ncbi:MAG: AMIN domain-containing protein, partial [Terriglobia bacterium]
MKRRRPIPAVLAACVLAGWACFSVYPQGASRDAARTPAIHDLPAAAWHQPRPLIRADSLPGQSVDGNAAPATVEYVSVAADGMGRTVIHIHTTRPVNFQSFQLVHPTRIVVDLDATQVTHFQMIRATQSPVLKDVRVAQFHVLPSPVARIVADLSAATPFRIQPASDGLQIRFNGRKEARQSLTLRTGAQGAPQVFHTHSGYRASEELAAAQLPGYSLGQTPFVDLSRPVKLDLDDPISSLPVRPSSLQAPANEQMAANGPPQPPHAQLRKIALAAPSDPSTPFESSGTDVPETTAAPAEFDNQTGSGGNNLKGAIVSTPFFSTAAPHYSGKLISLDLRDVDVKDFFRLIHRVSGLNLAVDPDVAGKITLVMDDVPWDEALDIVLKNNGLGKVVENGVVRIAKEQTLAAEANSQSQTRAEKLKAEPLVTVIRRL